MEQDKIIKISDSIIVVSKTETIVSSEWKQKSDDCSYEEMLQNIGIGLMDPFYIVTNDDQKKNEEYQKIINFLNRYIEYYSQQNKVSVSELKLTFINYGQTELVYVLEDNNNIRKTLLVKQPAVLFGTVKKELENLTKLYLLDQRVVKPLDYFSYGDQELYVTPYIQQARCVASSDFWGNYFWGMYIPEPYYRFVPFTEKQRSVVNTCMIAKLVSYYNFSEQKGICKCKLGGGDFMLPKNWENDEPIIDNTLDNLFFIAARDTVKCSFPDYLNIIRNEFSKSTITENQDDLIINLRGRVPMTKSEIENGIELGQKIIENRMNSLDEYCGLEKNKQLTKAHFHKPNN